MEKGKLPIVALAATGLAAASYLLYRGSESQKDEKIQVTMDKAAPVQSTFSVLAGDIGGTNVRLKLVKFTAGSNGTFEKTEVKPLTTYSS
jgi:hypothetical protein